MTTVLIVHNHTFSMYNTISITSYQTYTSHYLSALGFLSSRSFICFILRCLRFGGVCYSLLRCAVFSTTSLLETP